MNHWRRVALPAWFPQAKRHDGPRHYAIVDDVLMALLQAVGAQRVGPQRRTKIEEIMTKERTPVLLHVASERVSRFQIFVVHPGAQHAQTAQFAAMLVRDTIVGIVRARTLPFKIPFDLSGYQPAG